jgi:ankyrin repeat protein
MKDTVTRPDATRLLPERANLEHLKNEAKKGLRGLRLQDPGATLADAQLAVAHRYGFASWRKLKAHVDALYDAAERLIHAVRAGDLDSMRAVLDGSPELVNVSTDPERRLRPSDARAVRLIHLAVAENQMQAARLLIERGVSLNVRNADGRMPLHDCFELGRDELAQFLLAAGAEADVCAAAGYGMHERLLEILERDPEQANDLQTGLLPLGWSVYGNQPESARILLAHGAVVDRAPYDAEAWGPAAHVANIDVTRVLLENGANPNCPNGNGDTPIHAAIKSRLVVDPTAFVELLLAYGADRGIRNNEGRRAVDEARLQAGRVAETYFPVRPLRAKKLERVIELLG